MYGIDLTGLTGRSWPWLHTRIVGLLTAPTTRTYRALHPPQPATRPPAAPRHR